MASRSRKSSGSGKAGAIVWFFAIAGLIFAFFQIPSDPGAKGIQEVLVSKSQKVEEWVGGIAPGISDFIVRIFEGGNGTPTPGSGSGGSGSTGGGTGNDGNTGGADVSETQSKLNSLPVASASGNYNRDDWNHWVNVRSCWTVREQVLYSEAQEGSVTLKDQDGKPTSDVNKACEISGGTWVDPYSGNTFTNPKDLDIDHMIPLSYTNGHGGSSWDNKKKETYANELGYSNHLIAVSAKENRSKGDKGPSVWKPSNQAYWCQYATDWVNISVQWSLSTTDADKKALGEMLATCK